MYWHTLFWQYNLVKKGVDDMTTFFTVSAKQAVREQRIPFAISMDVPNADTIRAIDDVRNGRNLSRSFSSVEELMEDLNAED